VEAAMKAEKAAVFAWRTGSQISTREYRHMAMMNKTRDWHENLKLRERDYAVVIDSLSSFRTAHVDDNLHRLGKFWEHLGFLLEYSA
jgi:hypothetical protein